MPDRPESTRPLAGYGDPDESLGSYAALTLCFNAALAIGLIGAKRRDRLPEQVAPRDIIVLGVATHKLARLLTKDAVTSFLRAPFVRLEQRSGTNSRRETPRGTGMRRSVGELLSCPECTGQWVAAGLIVGLLHAPRVTRLLASMYASLAIGDLLQYVYTGIKSRA